MYNNGHIRALRQAIEALKKQNAVLLEYCTKECHICPLKDMCDWDGYIEYADAKLTDEVLDAYVDLYEQITHERERRTFKEVTGINAEWYDHNEDRTGE